MENIKKITYDELCSAMREFNNANEIYSKGGNDKYLKGVIVFTEDSFDKVYPLEGRSYEVNNDNKAWISGMSGYSIYGSSLDKTDPMVRLDYYMQAEHGGKDGWIIDYCYLIEDEE